MARMFSYSRSLEMKAPADKIFALLNDFHVWGQWSPWEKKEPEMKKIHTGAPAGVGAKYAWEGNKTGVGSMEILESAPPTMLRIKLDFSKPMKAQNETVFTLQSTGEMTKVTWTMTGVETLPSRIFGLFVNLDKMIGKDFEAGLQNLKEIVEA